MDENTDKKSGNVSINVEMSGDYDDIINIIGEKENKFERFEDIVSDFQIILDTIESINGGTKSRIINQLSSELSVEIETEELVPMLRVLETYNLVALEGNTWTSGENLDE